MDQHRLISTSERTALYNALKIRDCANLRVTGTKLHNTWRAIRFSEKGKKIGCDSRWHSFDNFREDMGPSHRDGLRLCREDKNKPFSRENCSWVNLSDLRPSKIRVLTHEGITKSLVEWAVEFDLDLAPLNQRFFKGKNYSSHEILFGKKKKNARALRNASEMQGYALRAKASKMMAQYRLTDRNKNFVGEIISIEWFIDNILKAICVYCLTPNRVGADRVDNNKGHTKENIVPACYRCNTTRGNQFTHEQMLKLGKFIREEIDNG